MPLEGKKEVDISSRAMIFLMVINTKATLAMIFLSGIGIKMASMMSRGDPWRSFPFRQELQSRSISIGSLRALFEAETTSGFMNLSKADTITMPI